MKISYSRLFRKMYKRLPTDIQERFRSTESLLVYNWHDSRLHTKQLKLKTVTYSMRITRDYRALFYLKSESDIVLFAIGHRKDIYKKLPRK